MAINLVSLDFEDIKDSLKNYFKTQDEFKDYNFDGSGLNTLLNVLAFDAQQNAYLANMLANESNIDTAVLRENVVSRAKIVGYTPKSQKAAKAVLSISINDPTNQSSSLLLPRGTRFTAGSAGNVYSFTTLVDYNLYLNPVSGQYENTEIEVFEGTIKAVSWTVDRDTRFVINNLKIDTDSLKVAVFPSYNDGNGETYERAIGLERVNPESRVFWIGETDGARFELLFGDNVFGKKPQITHVVYAEFLATNAADANGYNRFALAGQFAGYENSQITITTINPSNGGTGAESTNSIKVNAPRAYAAQGKATAPDDYSSLVTDLYPYAHAVNSWGGDEERPVKYGKTYISVIPQGGGVLTEYTKNDLIRKIKKRAVSGITPVFVDPEYIRFNMTCYANIRRNSIANLKPFSTELRTLIIDFFKNKFYNFDSSFYYSNLVTEIENYSRSINSVRLDFELSIADIIGRSTFNFKNAIVPGTIRSTKLDIAQNISSVSITDVNGKLYLDKALIGKVDYETGYIEITDNTISSSNNLIEIFVTPVNDDVIVSNRSVIIMDESRLSVELRSV